MRLYNTLTRREEDFAPLRDHTVRMYTCGLTVYNRGHIGNFRTFVVELARFSVLLLYVSSMLVRIFTSAKKVTSVERFRSRRLPLPSE